MLDVDVEGEFPKLWYMSFLAVRSLMLAMDQSVISADPICISSVMVVGI